MKHIETYRCVHTDDCHFILYMKKMSFAYCSEDLCEYSEYTVVWWSVVVPTSNTWLHSLLVLYMNDKHNNKEQDSDDRN